MIDSPMSAFSWFAGDPSAEDNDVVSRGSGDRSDARLTEIHYALIVFALRYERGRHDVLDLIDLRDREDTGRQSKDGGYYRNRAIDISVVVGLR